MSVSAFTLNELTLLRNHSGETMFVDCTFKITPPTVDWYRGAIPVKTDPRVTITFDPGNLYASMELKKCKPSDESKFRVQVEDEKGEETLEFAGFSVFVKGVERSGIVQLTGIKLITFNMTKLIINDIFK